MADPEPSPDILRRLDAENTRRGGIDAGKLSASRPEGHRRWPWWQKWVVVGAIILVFGAYLFFRP